MQNTGTNEQKKSGLNHFIHAIGWSLAGFRTTLRDEAAFRQELCLVLIAIPLAIYLGGNAFEKVLMIGSLILVLIVELLNTAIEAAIDRIGVEQHPLSGKAKDAGSAAVMLSILNVIFVWAFLLFSP